MGAEAGVAAAHSSIVVASPLAARQWELHLANDALLGTAPVWETPPVRTYASWLEQRWLDTARDEPSAILTAAQSAALWRRVVGESPAGGALIGHAGAAEWAAAAANLLRRWRVDPGAQRAANREIDFRAFLDWERRYRQILTAQGWRDRGDLEQELVLRPARAAEAVLATDLGEPYPARSALFAHLVASGTPIVAQAAPLVVGRRHAARLPDANQEVLAAFAWARDQLAAQPDVTVAIVVPDLEQRRDEIARLASSELRGVGEEQVWVDGGTLARDPAVGAAMSALSLLAPGARHAVFGRWLRSPFFGAPSEQGSRARLDRELRDSLRSQVPFATSYRQCGLREWLHERVPLTAASLARALAEVGTIARAAPSRWAHLWTRYLTALEWRPPATRSALLGWQSTLDELARLTPIVGEISLPTALAEVERILERATLSTPLPLRGVHVLRHIDDVGPRYHGVWAAGFTDTFWPEPPHGNPLLPAALQRALGLPYSSPQDAERRSGDALARLVARTPELIVSWPARVYDYETEPSPAIADWPRWRAEDVDRLTAARAGPPVRGRETVPDPAPAFTAARLPGATGALGRQARCPLRAFCQDRLGARALEPLGFGVSARLRGIAAHDAARRLLADLPSQEQLLAKPPSAIATATEQALDRVFGRARRSLGSLFELELEHLLQSLPAFLSLEAQRTPFRVLAVEEESEVTLGELRLQVRVDRLDELDDGSLAIIDYKTNARATGGDWFAPRLRDAQVPLYASHARATVGAAVIARLAEGAAGYSGIWSDAAFPGRRSQGALASLTEQLALWRTQLTALAAEFAAGDVRVLLAGYDEALGVYAPLTRIYEQLGIASGTTPRW